VIGKALIGWAVAMLDVGVGTWDQIRSWAIKEDLVRTSSHCMRGIISERWRDCKHGCAHVGSMTCEQVG